jgi:branched-subunit amino acid aminotransferase/4-amino-4-deoxychorismate lyase
VLLMRSTEHNDDLELLEGLTSNIFVIDKEGTLKTPQDGVLMGYARHLVLEAAHRLGWRVQCGSLVMTEMVDWDEVFCTSSIRMVLPVGQIVMWDVASQTTTVLWTNTQTGTQHGRTWQELYNEIILNVQPRLLSNDVSK